MPPGLDRVKHWAITINPMESAMTVLSRKQNLPTVEAHINGEQIPQVTSHKHLGLMINRKLSWTDHVEYIQAKESFNLALHQQPEVVKAKHL